MTNLIQLPEQTTVLTDDSFLMSTAAGEIKKAKTTKIKLVGYNDYLFVQDPTSTSGAGAPTLTTWQGNTKRAAFAGTGVTTREIFGDMHILHQYSFGTPISFHVHWTHNVAAPTGDVVWLIDYHLAKGHNVQAFPAATTITLVQTAGAQYTHHIIEGSDITSTDIEPDSVFICRIYRDPTHVSDTFANDAFFIRMDIHVKEDGMVTNEKTRPFTKV